MKPKVFVAREIPDAGLSRVAAACEMDLWTDELPPPRDILLQRVQGVEGLIATVADRIDGEVMDAAGPQLKVISNYAVGYDNIDIPAARARGIPVGNTPGVLTETTADLAFTLLLASARRVQESITYVRGGYWRTWGPKTLLGADVTGATLGIIGLGRIGQAMARRARGYDMRILAYGPHLTQERPTQSALPPSTWTPCCASRTSSPCTPRSTPTRAT
jgi:glyoxylate reductase